MAVRRAKVQVSELTAAGFEPAPFRTAELTCVTHALTQRLGPLGHAIRAGLDRPALTCARFEFLLLLNLETRILEVKNLPCVASTTPRRSRSGASGAPGPLTTPAPAGPTPPSPCPLWAPLSDLAPRGPPFLPPLRPPPAAPCGRRLLTTPAWRDGTAAAASTACERPP